MMKISVLVYDQVRLFEVGLVYEVWGVDRSDSGIPRFEVKICGPGNGSYHTDSGLPIAANADMEYTSDEADIIIVPGRTNYMLPTELEVQQALRRAHYRGAIIAGFCSGTFTLAHTGLLDGKQATTHWTLLKFMHTMFPKIKLLDNEIYVRDKNLWSSAGTAAGLDLCLKIVEETTSAEIAQLISRRLVLAPRREGNSRQIWQDSLFKEMIDWIVNNLGEEMSLEKLSQKWLMSPRTLNRKFVDQTGTPPMSWIRQQRVNSAMRLMQASSLSLENIAQETGFKTLSNLRAAIASEGMNLGELRKVLAHNC